MFIHHALGAKINCCLVVSDDTGVCEQKYSVSWRYQVRRIMLYKFISLNFANVVRSLTIRYTIS